MLRVQRPVPGGLVLHRGQKLPLHALFVQSLEGIFSGAVETGLDKPVGGDPEPAALAAEMVAEGPDNTDAAPGPGQTVQPGHASRIRRDGFRLRQGAV